MKIALGSDHAGFAYKEAIKSYLQQKQYEVVDFGTNSDSPVDYPVFIVPAAKAVASGECDRAVVLGGSGNGEVMAANRIRGVRCALCWSVETARLSRQHNDSNVMSIGARLVSLPLVFEMLDVWLSTPFEAGRHTQRIKMLDQI